MTATGEGEVVALRRLAEEMAKGRGERATTGHLLAAIASSTGGAAQLLRERRLDGEVLLKAARVLVDDHTDAVSRSMQRARELAARSPNREATGAMEWLSCYYQGILLMVLNPPSGHVAAPGWIQTFEMDCCTSRRRFDFFPGMS